MQQDDFVAIILAAGKGSRLYPYTKKISKVLLKVDEKTLLERNIEIIKNKFKKEEVHIIVSHYADEIKKYLESKGNCGINIVYHQIATDDIERGFIYSLLKLRSIIKKYFLIVMGDEVYFLSDHEKMFEEMQRRDFDIYCMLKEANFPEEILKNYSVQTDGERMVFLQEKPTTIINNYIGLGTIACSVKMLDLMEQELAKPHTRHFIDLLNQGIQEGLQAYYFLSHCEYYNINNKDDLFLARYSYRSKNINTCTKSLIIPAYNEAQTIGYVVRDFKKYVDDIIVMDNVSEDGTGEIARAAGARVFSRNFKGYGDAIRQGLREANSDILIITEADATFRANDLSKLLEYLKDADAVIGTRTDGSFVQANANMDLLLRAGNIIVGKLVSLLWWNRQCRLSDVGCTYRALWKSTYDQIKDRLTTDGPELSPEMMVEMLGCWLRLVEIPVKYNQRVIGKSKISISKWHSLIVGLKMLYCILSRRIQQWIENLKKTIALLSVQKHY
ncbi:MAG: glycosyltransferase [Candidatus Omnitrophica bacterium]|nr:glycosyltransferase [Candidatus Omnitrophota bacterium]